MRCNAPILGQQSTATHRRCRTERTGTMERAQDGIELRLLEGKALDAANDPVIDGAQSLSGWDPFEIWRTRVRGETPGTPTEGKDAID